jgi:hypothetical protein
MGGNDSGIQHQHRCRALPGDDQCPHAAHSANCLLRPQISYTTVKGPCESRILCNNGRPAMSPLAIALVSFGLFVLVGLIAKMAIGIWMKRSDANLPARKQDRIE